MERKSIAKRTKLIYLLMLLAGIAVIVQLFAIQITTDKGEIERLSKQVIMESDIDPYRGDILSSSGKVLATSVPYYEVGWDPNCEAITDKLFSENVDTIAECLAEILGESKAFHKKRMHKARNKGERYLRFDYSATYDQLKDLQNCPVLKRGRYGGGFVYFQRNEREHPFGVLAKRTIGTVSNGERKGVGLEDAFDKELRGEKGHGVKKKVAGDLWMPVNNGNEIEPKDGFDLITTIDVIIQDVAETALERRLRYHDADHGTAVVMKVNTGDVLAIANLKKNKHDRYIEAYNYAIGESIDPGSTFKLISAIAALEDNMVKPGENIETGNGVYYYYDYKMKDSYEGGFGTLTFREAFEKSSNIGISKVIFDNYNDCPDCFLERMYNLGVHEKLGISIRGEPEPFLRSPGDEKWSGLTLPHMAIGYDVKLTPLQMLALYNAVANDGKKVKPRFVKNLQYRGKAVREIPVEVLNPSICSKRTLNIIREFLCGVVERGTATNLKNDNYTVAGKTGTAQTNYGQGSGKLIYQSSFIGYFPADKPKYSILVVINDPKKNGYYGSQTACPVFREVADRIHSLDPELHPEKREITKNNSLPHVKVSDREKLNSVLDELKISRDKRTLRNCSWVYPVHKDSTVKYYIRDYSNDKLVPNVIGMGLSDAIKVLESKGFFVRVSGRGKVVSQSLEPNQPIGNNKIIKIKLS